MLVIRSVFLKLYFALMLFFTSADVALLIFSSDYRNILGVVDGRGIEGYAFRMLPAVALFFLFIFIFQKMLRGLAISRRLMLGKSVLFIILGLGTCVPWMGYFIVLLTPIAAPYFSIMIWTKFGYNSTYVLALAFVVVNIMIAVVSVRRNTLAPSP